MPDAGAPEAAAAATPDAAATAFLPSACVSKTVSLARDVQPIIQQRCGGIEGCHGFKVRTAAGTYKFLVNAKATGCADGRVLAAPGDPGHSYVIDKLADHELCNGAPMPRVLPGRPWTPLPQAQVQAIYDWICEGAPND
jgi:hypothetical protein